MTRLSDIMGTYDADQALTLPWVPNQELTRCLIAHGMPVSEAANAVALQAFRLFATSFYFDAIEAEKGNKQAKERVDMCRHIWNEQAKREKANERKVSVGVSRSI